MCDADLGSSGESSMSPRLRTDEATEDPLDSTFLSSRVDKDALRVSAGLVGGKSTPCDFWFRSPTLVCERGYSEEPEDTGGGSERLEVEGMAVWVRDGGRGRTKVGDRVLRVRAWVVVVES